MVLDGLNTLRVWIANASDPKNISSTGNCLNELRCTLLLWSNRDEHGARLSPDTRGAGTPFCTSGTSATIVGTGSRSTHAVLSCGSVLSHPPVDSRCGAKGELPPIPQGR